MAMETGFEETTNSKLIELAEQNFGYLPVVAELLNRFTTLVDNWNNLNSQAMDAVTEKQKAEKEKNIALAGLESLFRQNNVMTTCMHDILRYFKDSKDEILMSCGAEVVMHITDILDKTVKELNNIKEGKE